MKRGWEVLQRGLANLRALGEERGNGAGMADGSYERYRPGLWQQLAGRNPDLLDAADDVAAEQQGRLALVSRDEALNRWLLAQIRQQPVTPAGGRVVREGVFTLVHLREEQAGEAALGEDALWSRAWLGGEGEEVVDLLTGMDVLLYVFCPAAGEMALDMRWWARLRATRAAVLPIVVTAAAEAEARQAGCEAARRQLGVKPVCLTWEQAGESDEEPPGTEPASGTFAGFDPTRRLVEAESAVVALVERILALRGRLAVALAQEAPLARHLIVRRVIRTGALMTTMLGAEPVPLLDLPLQVAVQWKVALQLAAIYGRPGLEARSREMMGTILLNLCVRQVAQQAIKLVPGVGWLLSGLVSGGSTWVLGQALVRLYEEERLLAGPQAVWAQVKRAAGRGTATPT